MLCSTKWCAANTGSLSDLRLLATDPGSAQQHFVLQRVRDDGEERFSVGRALTRHLGGGLKLALHDKPHTASLRAKPLSRSRERGWGEGGATQTAPSEFY